MTNKEITERIINTIRDEGVEDDIELCMIKGFLYNKNKIKKPTHLSEEIIKVENYNDFLMIRDLLTEEGFFIEHLWLLEDDIEDSFSGGRIVSVNLEYKYYLVSNFLETLPIDAYTSYNELKEKIRN